MAVPNLPFWLSAANTEFSANGWGSNILSKAGLGTTGFLGQLAGKSAVIVVNLPGGALNDVNVLSYVSGTSGKNLIINVPANAAYRSTTTGGPALRCVIPDANSVTLNIASGTTVWGKGGNGGAAGQPGQAGSVGSSTISNPGGAGGAAGPAVVTV